ncbi:hypothetical protein PMAYCL1PPCAC_29753 [Pristionchus mayeri]|uniref:Major facilitator superfamily (MFS) profile domain-containing protein n=1 Tax=Pristionchus mayeri TaxID=1317129 RepID=A0AAN5DAL6_9BILA|nr:hypothetical protein PMAYCL1PPCAC_29753 [Pristionchus mayeri]
MGSYGSNGDEAKIITKQHSNLLRRILSTLAISTTLCMMSYDGRALDGVIPLMQKYFSITDSRTALLQTLGTVTSSVALVVVGVIGDRVEKRSFVLLAISHWLLLNGLSIFVPQGMYWLFLSLRTMADIGHAVVGALTPVIYSDFYTDRSLGRALVVNTLANFIGMISSSSISSIFLTSGLPWQTALLPSLAITLPVFVLLLFSMPKTSTSPIHQSRGYIGDIKHLLSIKSYIFLVVGASLASMYGKAAAFWMPTVVFYAWSAVGEKVFGSVPYAGVMTINSMLSLGGSFIGLPLFMYIAENWQYGGSLCGGRKFSRAIPLIVALLQLCAVSTVALNLLTLTSNYVVNMTCHFFLTFFGSPMASLLPMLVLSISPRGQRATAYALLNLLTGLVGSPAAQIVGLISDSYRGEAEDAKTRFDALAFAFYIIMSFFFAASVMYFTMMKYYPEDVRNREEEEGQPLVSPFDSPLDERRKRDGSIVERALSRRATMDTVYA